MDFELAYVDFVLSITFIYIGFVLIAKFKNVDFWFSATFIYVDFVLIVTFACHRKARIMDWKSLLFYGFSAI